MDWFIGPRLNEDNEENKERLRDLRFRFGYHRTLPQLEFLESRDYIKEIEEHENLNDFDMSNNFKLWKKDLEKLYGDGKSLEELAILEKHRLLGILRRIRGRHGFRFSGESNRYWTVTENWNYWKDLQG
jgi:hypothetical protein